MSDVILKTKKGNRGISVEKLYSLLDSGKLKEGMKCVSIDQGETWVSVGEALDSADTPDVADIDIDEVVDIDIDEKECGGYQAVSAPTVTNQKRSRLPKVRAGGKRKRKSASRQVRVDDYDDHEDMPAEGRSGGRGRTRKGTSSEPTLTFGRVLLCVFLPPFAVTDQGCGVVLLVWIATLFGWVPGMVAAVIFNMRHVRRSKSSMAFAGAFVLVFAPLILIGAVLLGGLGAGLSLPILSESRMQANETNAATSLRTYATAQYIYKKGDFSNNGQQVGDRKSYATNFASLGGKSAHKKANGEPIKLIPDAFADATSTNGYNGYYFIKQTSPKIENWTWEFGLYAVPCSYGKTGIHTFHIDSAGIVKMKDLGGRLPDRWTTIDKTWIIP